MEKNEVNKNDRYNTPSQIWTIEPGMSWLEDRCNNHYTNGPCWQR